LLKEDVATGLVFENAGKVITSLRPGLGIKFTDMFQKEF